MKKHTTILTLAFILITQLGFSQWSFHSDFPKTSSIIDITVGQAGNVYLLTSDRQIYSSLDNGNTWTSFIETPLFLNVLDIEASTVSGRVFAKTNCCGVAYTDNFGANWLWDNLFTQPSGLGLSPSGIDVFQSKTVAVTFRFATGLGIVQELYTSNSNGTNSTWSLAHTFTPEDHLTRDVFLLNTNLVFASFGLFPGSPAGTTTLKRSTNGGTTFTDVTFFDDKDLVDLVIDATSNTIYCATNTTTAGEMYQSDDLGVTWTAIALPTASPRITKFAFDATNDFLYVLTENGIFRKTTAGSWQNVSTQPNLVTIDVNNNEDILTGGLQTVGVQKSVSSPINFETIEIGGDFSPEWVRVSGTTIFIGNTNNPIISKSDISTPNTWQHTAIQNVPLSVEAVAFGATVGSFGAQVKTDGNITISGNNYIADMDSNLNFTVIADEASGAPLAPISNPAFVPQNLKLSNNDEILIQQLNANYIDTSVNGTTWSVLNPIIGQPTKTITDFSAGTNNFYVLTNDFAEVFGDEVHYSTNGTTWNSIPLPNNTVGSNIFIDNQDTLYLLGTGPLALYRLDLTNEQWITTSLNLHNDPNTYFELAFDNNNNMYAINFRTTSTTSTSQGIAYSDDQGVTWTNESFPIIGGNTVYLESLGFDDDGILYAKSSNDDNNVPSVVKGIYSFESTLLSVSEFDVSSISIYPNPVSDFFNVKIEEKGVYAIYDLLGRKISSGNITQGNNIIQFPRNVASGIYVFTVKAKTKTFSKKIILENK